MERGLFQTARKAFMEAQILNVASPLFMHHPISMKPSIMTHKANILKIMIYMGSSHQGTFMKDQFASIHQTQTFCVH